MLFFLSILSTFAEYITHFTCFSGLSDPSDPSIQALSTRLVCLTFHVQFLPSRLCPLGWSVRPSMFSSFHPGSVHSVGLSDLPCSDPSIQALSTRLVCPTFHVQFLPSRLCPLGWSVRPSMFSSFHPGSVHSVGLSDLPCSVPSIQALSTRLVCPTFHVQFLPSRLCPLGWSVRPSMFSSFHPGSVHSVGLSDLPCSVPSIQALSTRLCSVLWLASLLNRYCGVYDRGIGGSGVLLVVLVLGV